MKQLGPISTSILNTTLKEANEYIDNKSWNIEDLRKDIESISSKNLKLDVVKTLIHDELEIVINKLLADIKDFCDTNFNIIYSELDIIKKNIYQNIGFIKVVNIEYNDNKYIGDLQTTDNKFSFVVKKEHEDKIPEEILLDIYNPYQKKLKGKVNKLETINNPVNNNFNDSDIICYECTFPLEENKQPTILQIGFCIDIN
jgi:hypothetical protein